MRYIKTYNKISNDPLRVSFFSHSSLRGGAELSLLELINGLSKRHIQCHVVLPSEGYLFDELSKLPVSIDIIPIRWWTCRHEEDNKLIWDEIIDSSARIAEIVSKFSPDLIYTNTSVIAQGALVASFLKIPHIWHINEYGEKDHKLTFLLDIENRAKFIYDYSDNIIFNSRALKIYFDQFINSNKSVVSYTLIELHGNEEEYPKIFKKTDSLKLLLIGQIQPGKGQLEALNALKYCIDKWRINVILAIVGGVTAPDYYDEIQSFINNNDLRDYVTLRDFLNNPMCAYRESDVVLMCSRSETFGRVTAEAMRLGKTVIGANAGGTPELIKHQKTGLLYEAGNYKDLAKKIGYLYKNRGKISELGNNAMNFVDNKLTEEEYCGKIYHIMLNMENKRTKVNSPVIIHKELIIKYNNLLDSLNNLNKEIQRKNHEIATVENQLKETKQLINNLLGSRSWRITRPLRQIAAVIRGLRNPRYLLVTLARLIYDGCPFPQHIKTQIKSFVFTYFGVFFKGSDAYDRWLDATSQRKSNLEPIEIYYEKVPFSVDKITGLTFRDQEAPIVSIVIPVFNNWRYTYACLQAIRERSGDGIPYEVIIADDGSTDDTRVMLDRVKGIHTIFNKTNLGFLKNCNNAATHAHGRYILFLNNDTEVQDGWLEPLVRVFENFNDIGMVGGKLLYPNGQLQEAGGIIWNDGSCMNFGRGDDPRKPEYNFVREVDYCSGACILIRKELWNKVGGFDEQFRPAYCEDSDFAIQIREAGYKVFYQPESRVVHFEGISSGTDLDSGVKRYQAINQEKLVRKWEATLEAQSTRSEELFWARDRSQSKKIILVIDDTVPEYDQHAGALTTYQYLRLFCDMGFKVIFLPDNLCPLAPYTSELQQLGVEVIYGDINIKRWLVKYGKYLHYAWLSRPDIASKYIDLLKNITTTINLYYTHDLHYLRERRRYELDHNPLHLEESQRQKNMEFELFSKVDVILTPSNYEERVIKESFPHKNVYTILPFFYEFTPEDAKAKVDFSQREGMLFLGGYNHPPNVDAVLWFVKEILPRVREQLPEVTFTVAGSNPPREILALQNESLRVTGYVPDLRPLFEKARVFVAPLRYGAGVKGKIITSMVYGVPVVTTSIGNEGINLADGQEALIADGTEAFATSTVELYTNQALWGRLAHEAQTYVRHHFGTEKARQLIQDVLAKFQCASDAAFNQAAEAALKKQDILTRIRKDYLKSVFCNILTRIRKDYLESVFCKYLPIEQRRIFLDTSDPVRYGAIKLAIEKINNYNIPGALAEVGVYQGHTSRILHMLAPNRHLFLFDTFEGFPNNDLEGRIDNRFKDTNIDIVKEVIGSMDNIEIRKGYFPETTTGLENEIFAFVMLDADLYTPTLSGLNFFYNRLSPGGYIFIHDYSNRNEVGVYKAVNEFMGDKREGIICIPDTWGSAIICKNKQKAKNRR